MSTHQQQPTGCFICSKQRGEILIPGRAIYEDDLLYVGHIKMDEEQPTYLGQRSKQWKK